LKCKNGLDVSHGSFILATIHVGTLHRFCVIVWCGRLHGQIIGPFVFKGNLTHYIYLKHLPNELLDLLGDVILEN
jgi:hypothetical protein